MKYEIVVRPHGSGYRGIVPQIPGIWATGSTPGQALDAAYQALCSYFTQRGQAYPSWQVVRAELEPSPSRIT